MKKIIVDSCVWIAVYLKKDKYHQKGKYFFDWLGEQDNVKIIINDFIISETLTFLKRKGRNFPKSINEVIELFQNDRRIDIFYTSKDLFNEAIRVFKKYEDLSVVDSIIFSFYFVIEPNYLLTYDKRFFSFDHLGLLAFDNPV